MEKHVREILGPRCSREVLKLEDSLEVRVAPPDTLDFSTLAKMHAAPACAGLTLRNDGEELVVRLFTEASPALGAVETENRRTRSKKTHVSFEPPELEDFNLNESDMETVQDICAFYKRHFNCFYANFQIKKHDTDVVVVCPLVDKTQLTFDDVRSSTTMKRRGVDVEFQALPRARIGVSEGGDTWLLCIVARMRTNTNTKKRRHSDA